MEEINQNNDEIIKQSEKKSFYSLKEHCIMEKLEKGFFMFSHSRTAKIISFSIVGFCAGLCLTLITFLSFDRPNHKRGVGGYETSVLPELDENISSLLSELSETEESYETDRSDTQFDDFFQDDEAVVAQNEEPSPLTYQTYRVKSGDMIGFIADEFNVTQDTIISVNNIKQSRLIQPGQYLKIPSMPGIIYTVKKNGETAESIAKKYEINAEKCAFVNNINVSSELNAGAVVFVPDAELDWTTRQEINGDLFKKPLHSRYWLSSPYGWRDSPFSTGKRTFHGGLDMAASQGTPVYPALDGKVTAVGFNSTYGNYVIISHHSGYKTLYAHMSTVNCKKGNFVYTNTMIGRVGSTGMSTGPHLHFTVYKNGKTVNPSLLLN